MTQQKFGKQKFLKGIQGPSLIEPTRSAVEVLTLRLLMSCIYMELLVKPEMLTSYIYGPTFGNAETVLSICCTMFQH